jgi:hypothetical protein
MVGLAPSGDTLVNKLDTMLTGLGYTTHQFAAESDFESYIRSTSYPSVTNVCFGIVVTSSTGGNYQYKLRFNISNNKDSSDGPSPSLKLTEDSGIDLSLYYRMEQYGMLGTNTLVNNAILQLETASTNYFEKTVAPLYQQAFILDNIFTDLGDNIGTLVLLPLILIYLRQTSIMLTEKEVKFILYSQK